MAFEQEFRDLSFVTRWNTVRRIRNQNVAEHSYYNALYANQIAIRIAWSGDIAKLLRAALVHDLEEVLFGDSPGPAKRLTQDRGRAEDVSLGYVRNRFDMDTLEAFIDSRRNYEIAAILKVADRVDEIFWAHNEYNMGNTYVNMGHQRPTRLDLLEKLLADLKRDWAHLPFGNVSETVKSTGWLNIYDKARSGPRFLKEGEF